MKWRWVFTLATINNTYLGKKNHFTSILHFPSQSVNTTKKCNFLFVSKNYFIILLYLFDIVQGILQARILEWVACPFSSGSSWPRNRTRVFCIAGGFFTNWALREALIYVWKHKWSYICIWIWDMKWGKSAKQNEGRLRTLIQERKKTGS